MIFKKGFLVLYVHVENVGLSLPLDSRSPKGHRAKLMRSIPRFFSRVLPQANRIHLRMLLALQHQHSRLSQGPFLPLIRTRSGSLDFSSRVTSRDWHQNSFLLFSVSGKRPPSMITHDRKKITAQFLMAPTKFSKS